MKVLSHKEACKEFWSRTTWRNKNKVRRTCQNYSILKVPCKHQKIIGKLFRNTQYHNITILRKDKGRGVTTLDLKDFIQKCVSILNTSHFQKLDTNRRSPSKNNYGGHYEK